MKNKKILGVIIGGVVLSIFLAFGLAKNKKTREETQPLFSPKTSEEGKESEDLLERILDRGKKIGSVKYEMVINSDGQLSESQKVWLKGMKMRIEMNKEGQEIVNLIDSEKRIIYTYFPSQNMAIKMKGDKEELQTPLAQMDMEKYDPKVLGTEIVEGKNCLIVEYSLGETKVKVWLWEEKGFPVKMETKQDGKTVVMEFKNIEFAEIPENLFELPAGVKITELSQGQE